MQLDTLPVTHALVWHMFHLYPQSMFKITNSQLPNPFTTYIKSHVCTTTVNDAYKMILSYDMFYESHWFFFSNQFFNIMGLSINEEWTLHQKIMWRAITHACSKCVHITIWISSWNNIVHALQPNYFRGGVWTGWAMWIMHMNVNHNGFVETLQRRHNGHDSVSNRQPYDCLLNRLFRHRSKKTSKLRVTGLCAGNSPGTGGFPAQMASNADNVSIWWRHHESITHMIFYVVHQYYSLC